MRNVIIWLALFIPALAVELLAYLLNPIVALFVVKELRTDRVKLFDNRVLTFDREYLIKPLRWFQTHDNAVDEWFWGAFYKDSYWRFLRELDPVEYDNSWWIRYLCRVHWMYRNNAYGFLYNLFGKPREELSWSSERGVEKSGQFWYYLQVFPSSWKLEAEIPWPFTKRYTSINIGWKAHKGFDKVMYANRLINFRKYKHL
jgi:hypothetical protein